MKGSVPNSLVRNHTLSKLSPCAKIARHHVSQDNSLADRKKNDCHLLEFTLLMATARLDHHVVVFFEDHVVAIVEKEHGDGGQFCRGAASLRNHCRIHEMYECLDNGVICCVHLRGQREGTLPFTEERRITIGCYDPILPFQLLKTNEQRPPAAQPGAALLLCATDTA